MRSIASRWLIAIAIVAGATVLLPGLAAGADAVADPATALQPATPAGEVAPAPAPDGTATDPAPPASETPSGDETTAPDATVSADGGSAAAPAPPPADVPVAEGPATPGAEATPTPAPTPAAETPVSTTPTPLPTTPDLPTTPLATAPPVPVTVTVPATPDRVAAIVPGIPSVSVAPTAPDQPTIAKVVGPKTGKAAPAAPGVIPDFVTAILNSSATAEDALATTASTSPTSTPPHFGPTVEDPEFVQPMVIPVGPAPSGSSLLSVLAGYVLPGSSGAPPTTLVLFIVLGLILGVSYGAFPQLTERLSFGRLLGASTGHELAVRRPG